MSTLDTSSARDPSARFRPFRVGAYVLHIAFSSAVSLTVSVGVIRGVLAASPDHSRPEAVLDVRACTGQVEELWTDLDAHRQRLARPGGTASAAADWQLFRVDWLLRHRAVEARCLGSGAEREAIADLLRRLEKLMDLYTTDAVQFAGEVGPSVDDFLGALERSRKPGAP